MIFFLRATCVNPVVFDRKQTCNNIHIQNFGACTNEVFKVYLVPSPDDPKFKINTRENQKAIKNGQSRDRQQWTIQRQTTMDNPETDNNGQSRERQQWTIQRQTTMDNPETNNNGHKTQNEDKQNKKHNTENQKDKEDGSNHKITGGESKCL